MEGVAAWYNLIPARCNAIFLRRGGLNAAAVVKLSGSTVCLFVYLFRLRKG